MIKKNISLLFIGMLLLFTNSCQNEDVNITVKDIDGNVYHTVTIGTQVWMVENLKTTKFRNGNAIPNVTEDWTALTTGAYCNYDNDVAKGNINGRLYNWYAVNDSRMICPVGWHVPSDAEWKILTDYLSSNNYGYEGSNDLIAKSLSSKSGWNYSTEKGNVGNDPSSNNSTGFSALPSGEREERYGDFQKLGTNLRWWSSNEISFMNNSYANMIMMGYNYGIVEYLMASKKAGFSVRCLKD